MASLASRVALLVACLALALPAAALAGSTQANLAVAVVVPARCALRVAETVVMKCTKGTLPPADGSASARASAVGPRISRAVVLASAPAGAVAPLPLTEHDPAPAASSGAGTTTLVVTVNF